MSNFKIHHSYGESSVQFITFSDGSETCRVDPSIYGSVRVQCDVEDATRDIIRLGLVKDALDRLLMVDEVALTLSYMPQARADRVFEEGMPHPLKVFSNILNSYGFCEVSVADPHSDVVGALVDNVAINKQEQCLSMTLPLIKKYLPEFTLCAPDLGATKKIFDSVQLLGHNDYIQAVKIRDVATGNIVKCDVQCDDLQGQDILIVDDILDFGNSFKFLAQKLKANGAGKIGLYVTHGIFAGGLESLKKDIDFIFCYDIVGTYINREDVRKFNER